VPFMDVTDWGEHQHELHAKVGSLRAQEYRIPIFRLGSSGISQLIDSNGRIDQTASFAAEEAKIGGIMMVGEKARLPIDSWLAPICVGLTGVFFACLLVTSVLSRAARGTKRGANCLCSEAKLQ
jgi:apolipoprotein N-acyltransferase